MDSLPADMTLACLMPFIPYEFGRLARASRGMWRRFKGYKRDALYFWLRAAGRCAGPVLWRFDFKGCNWHPYGQNDFFFYMTIRDDYSKRLFDVIMAEEMTRRRAAEKIKICACVIQ